jgi:hypothetical protein
MALRERITEAYIGFTTKSEKIVDMDVDFLFELAHEEAPFRGEEDLDSMKDIIYDKDAYEKSPRIKKLFDEWDLSKCEPLDVKKEGTIYMINNGFHRIRVAKDKGIKTLKVNLQEGKFILTKHISFFDLKDVISMIRLMFKDYKTFEELENFLADKKLDERKMKHIFIGYGGLIDGKED